MRRPGRLGLIRELHLWAAPEIRLRFLYLFRRAREQVEAVVWSSSTSMSGRYRYTYYYTDGTFFPLLYG